MTSTGREVVRSQHRLQPGRHGLVRLDLRRLHERIPERQDPERPRRLGVRLPRVPQPHRVEVDLDGELRGLHPGPEARRVKVPEDRMAPHDRAGVVVAGEERPEHPQRDFEDDERQQQPDQRSPWHGQPRSRRGRIGRRLAVPVRRRRARNARPTAGRGCACSVMRRSLAGARLRQQPVRCRHGAQSILPARSFTGIYNAARVACRRHHVAEAE